MNFSVKMMLISSVFLMLICSIGLAIPYGTTTGKAGVLNPLNSIIPFAFAGAGVGIAGSYVFYFYKNYKIQPSSNLLGNLWGGFTGAISGLGKAIYSSAMNRISTYGDILGSLFKGDFSGAWNKYYEMKKNDFNFLVNTVKNHWKEILIGVIICAAIIMAAPVVIPAAAAFLGVSTAAVTTGMIIAGTVAAAGYVATTYGPLLNKVNDTCDWRGNGQYCDKSKEELGERALTDGLIIAGSVGLGSFGQYYTSRILTGRIVDHPKFLKMYKRFMKITRGINVVDKTNEFRGTNIIGAYDPKTKILSYGEDMKFGHLMHETLHTTQHARMGYPRKLNPNVLFANEIDAHTFELQNAKRFGYSKSEINAIKGFIQEYKTRLFIYNMFNK